MFSRFFFLRFHNYLFSYLKNKDCFQGLGEGKRGGEEREGGGVKMAGRASCVSILEIRVSGERAGVKGGGGARYFAVSRRRLGDKDPKRMSSLFINCSHSGTFLPVFLHRQSRTTCVTINHHENHNCSGHCTLMPLILYIQCMLGFFLLLSRAAAVAIIVCLHLFYYLCSFFFCPLFLSLIVCLLSFISVFFVSFFCL